MPPLGIEQVRVVLRSRFPDILPFNPTRSGFFCLCVPEPRVVVVVVVGGRGGGGGGGEGDFSS